MNNNFWAELPKPFFILAPMEDVTDVVFRHVVKEAGAPDVFFTEFTNSDSFAIRMESKVFVDDWPSQRMNSRWWRISGEINQNFSVR